MNMIKVIDYEKDSLQSPCVLLLGFFDGLHIGHRALIQRAKSLAERFGCIVGIMTFYDAKNGGQIYVFDERKYLFERAGLDFVFAADYGEAFRSLGGIEFLKHIVTVLDVRAFVCGEDFTFGSGARWGVADLKEFGKIRGIEVVAEPAVVYGGEKAAATGAKKLLSEGRMEELALLLGEKYFIRGEVVSEGRKVGRTLGFPTANIHVPSGKYPLKRGVYAVCAEVDGALCKGIANCGPRPTFEDERSVLEVYFDGYSGDLYGKTLTVRFDSYIRAIRKFASAEELSAQLKTDLEKIR